MNPPEPPKKIPREIIGRALRDPGFRAYLLNHPEECLEEHGYSEHIDTLAPKIKAMTPARIEAAVSAFKKSVQDGGGPD